MMFGQDIGAMIEARNAREWEEANREPEMDPEAVDLSLGDALSELTDACGDLAMAAAEAEGFPYAARIMSLFADLETIQDEITSLRARISEEVKSA